MTNPIFTAIMIATDGCSNRCPYPEPNYVYPFARNKPFNITAQLLIAATVVDSITITTCLVIGILAVLSVFVLPSALSYSLISLSAIGALLWIALAFYDRGNLLQYNAFLLKKCIV